MRAPRTAESAKGPPKRYIIYFFQGFAKEDCRRVFRGLWPDAAPARGAASRPSLAGLGERGKNGSGIVGRDVEIGRAHVCTPAHNAQLVCRHMIEKKTLINIILVLTYNHQFLSS